MLATVVNHFDQPFGNPTALLSYQISQATRREVKVVLGGDGGDELFGVGIPVTAGFDGARTYRHLPSALRGLAGRLSHFLPESRSGAHNWRRTRQFLTATFKSPAAMYLD